MAQAPRTRDVMLREAARLFAERGFRGTSVADLGTACGISGPALYKHFPNKQAILARLLVDISQQLVDGGRAVVDAGGDPPDVLAALVDFHTDFALAEPDVIRVQDRDLANLPAPSARAVRRLQRAYVETWVQALQEWDPSIGDAEARARTHAVFGLLNSTPHSAARSRSEAARQLSQMALRALVG